MSLPIRKSPRANWHNYNGAEYFVTICTKNRAHYFGNVHEGEMQLTMVGEWLKQQIENVQSHYKYAEIPLYVIMPNHVHIIVVIDWKKIPYDRSGSRDAACHVRNNSENFSNRRNTRHDITDAARDVPTARDVRMREVSNRQGWLSVCIGGIKSSVTRFAHENNIPFAWQSRYHDHIIRHHNEMNRIAEYIEQNPLHWEIDCFYN